MSPPPSDRVHCPVARDCGACALIGRDYSSQLQLKTGKVREAFAAWPDLPSERIEPCLAAPRTLEYRGRAKLAVWRRSAGVRIGLYRRGTNQVVDLAPCRVQRPAVQEAIERLRRWLSRHRLARPGGPVFYLDLREARGGCHVTLVLDGEVDPARLPVDKLAEDWPGLAGVAVNIGDARSSYPMGPVTTSVYGDPLFEATVPSAKGEPLAFRVPPAGFFQVAPSALPAVHDLMAGHLGEVESLFDLYCGVGVHGLAVARRATRHPRVVGVESSASLAEAARRNATDLGVEASYVASRVETALETWSAAGPRAGIILNPGRSGCHPDVVRALREVPSKLAYLSCNPVTLARDLAALQRPVARILPLDLMPQTDHTEVLALV